MRNMSTQRLVAIRGKKIVREREVYDECALTKLSLVGLSLQPQALMEYDLVWILVLTNPHPCRPSVHRVLVPWNGIRGVLLQPCLAKGYEAESECETNDESRNHPNQGDHRQLYFSLSE